MDRQACTGDTVLAQSREMTGTLRKEPNTQNYEQNTSRGGRGVKTTENKIHWPLGSYSYGNDEGVCSLKVVSSEMDLVKVGSFDRSS